MRVSLFAVLFVVASTPALASDEPEAKYKGKPLAYWVERLHTAPTDEQQKAAAVAVASFGRDVAPALPELLAMLEDHSWEFRDVIVGILKGIGPDVKDAVPMLAQRLKENKTRYPHLVIDILRDLDPDRTETSPALIAALEHREIRFFAVTELCQSKTVVKEALPALRRIALEIVAEEEKNPSKSVQKWVPYGGPDRHGDPKEAQLSECVEHLHGLGKDAVPILHDLLDAPGKVGKTSALIGFAKLGPIAVKSAPAVKKLLKHDDPRMRYRACVALWEVAESPDVVPVLVQLLDVKPAGSADRDFDLPMATAMFLGEIGPVAKDALPALNALARKQPAQAVAPTLPLITAQTLPPNSAPEAATLAIEKIESKEKKSLPGPLDRY